MKQIKKIISSSVATSLAAQNPDVLNAQCRTSPFTHTSVFYAAIEVFQSVFLVTNVKLGDGFSIAFI